MLPARYDVDDLAGKARCKTALQERMRLPARADAFVFGTVSRFDAQKGIPLIAEAIRVIAPLPVQLVALGSGDPVLEQQLRALAAAYPQQVAVTIGFDEGLAHLIEAGADAFVSRAPTSPAG